MRFLGDTIEDDCEDFVWTQFWRMKNRQTESVYGLEFVFLSAQSNKSLSSLISRNALLTLLSKSFHFRQNFSIVPDMLLLLKNIFSRFEYFSYFVSENRIFHVLPSTLVLHFRGRSTVKSMVISSVCILIRFRYLLYSTLW